MTVAPPQRLLLLPLLLLLLADRIPQIGCARPYVRKCCKADMALNETGCQEVDEPLRSDHRFEVPKFVNTSGVFGVHETNKLHIIYERPYCANGSDDNFFVMDPEENNHSFFISDTAEIITGNNSEIHFTSDEYCLERKFFENNYINYIVIACPPINKVATAYEATTETTPLLHYSIYSYTINNGMIISLPFLFSTFLTYAFIKELRSSWHVKFQMCHVVSLFLAYTAVITNNNFIDTIYDKNNFCLILAYTQQFFFIATCFWLNAMCFNIWWTLCEFKPINRNKQKETKKFIKYSVYAWGCSLLISMITYLMDEVFSSPDFIRPGFGYSKCWFSNHSATWIYFYGPITILLFSDLLMFIHISKILLEREKICQEYFKGSESSRSRKYTKQNFILYLKLFIITGGNWLAEIISYEHREGGIWGIIDILNALQGVFIFIIFVCQKRVLTLLKRKLCSGLQQHNLQTKNRTKKICNKTNASTINENLV